MKQKIIKTATNTFKTTENTKISEDSGNYTLSGEYIKSEKKRTGDVFINALAIDHVETLNLSENE